MAADPESSVQCLEEELVSLRSQAETLRQELKTCKGELQQLQKQLSQSERLQKTTESYNEDLRQQVSQVLMENRDSWWFKEHVEAPRTWPNKRPQTCEHNKTGDDIVSMFL